MPDVGVLELTIRDNSTTAAGGLTQLSDALRAVKDACKGGLNLSNGKMSVAQQIQTLANTVRSESTVIKNLGTLFNAISNFSKLKDIQINTQPIVELKHALEGGMNIGKAGTEINKLREALTGDWGNEQSISIITTGMSNIASASSELQSANTAIVVRNVAKSIKEYASAVESISGGGAHDYLTQQVFSSFSNVQTKSTGTNIAKGIKEGIDSEKEAVRSSSVEMVKEASDAADQELGIHSPSYVYYKKGEMSGVGYAEGFISTKGEIQTAVKETLSLASEGVKWALNAPNMVDMDAFRQSVMPDALTSLGQKYIYAGDAAKSYTENINAAIPALREYRDTALSVQSKQDLAGFSKKTGEDLATPIKEAEQAIVQSTDNIREHVQETVAVVQEAVKEGYGTGSIKGLYEDNRIGPVLGGLFGSDAQMAMIKKVAEGTGLSVDEIKRQLVELSGGAVTFDGTIKSTCSSIQDSVEKVTGTVKNAGETAKSNPIVPIDQLIEAYDHADYLRQKIEELKRILETKREMGILTSDETDSIIMKIRRLQEEYRKLTGEVEKTKDENSSLSFSFKDLKKGIEKMFPTLTSLFKSFTRMAKMRAIRYVIRQIAAGFKEGTQNVYEYSKAIGSTFHTSMDEAASSLAQMKNALGAQLAPLLQMLIPVLQRVVNWFINVTNVVNQFFALINGQKSWTRALPQTVSAFDKQTKAAKSASAAMKDLLADWDELNIIQSESGGGGGGAGTTAAEDYLNMFEEVYTFDNKIKDTVQWVQDHMEEIKTVAEAIGLSILGWKISEAFGLTLGTLQKLELIGGIILTIASIKLLASAAYDIGKDGINGENALDAVAGVLGTMVGTAVAGFAIGGVVGAAIGLIVGAAISLAVTGINIREGKLDSLYGDVSKDVDDIRKELEENVLTADATMTVNVAQAKIKDVKDAETKVTNAINELNKTYPLGVEITPTNADDFIGKVNALVAADNELLQKSGEVLNLTVPASPQWGNEGDFHTFLDEALGDVSSYVTGIGEEIGKLISQGITKGTKLDELRKQLEEISVAILTAQKSSEFSAAVGIAGATARNMKQYDRKTIENYMTEYATLLQGKMGEAQAQATAEYVELQRTVAAYEELGKNNAEEYDPEVMKKLREELAAWDNGKRVNVRAQELVDEWTAVGRELYKNDILSLLSGNMIKNKNTGWRYSALYGSGSMSQEPINIINSYDDKRKREWADEYIEQGNKILKDIIQSETGINGDVVLNFANASGLSLLDFFDAGFAKEFEDSILKVVSQIDIPQSEKERIYAAFGMDYNNYNVPKEIEEAIVKYSEGGLDTREINQILEHFDITNERLNRYIQILGYENLFGEHYYTERDDTGYLNPDEAEKAMRFIASAGSVSDVGWGQYYPVAQPEQEELTEVDFARAVETGTTNANVNQNMLFEQMISLLGQIAGKDFTVNITPTSTAGAFVNRSIAKFNMIAHD